MIRQLVLKKLLQAQADQAAQEARQAALLGDGDDDKVTAPEFRRIVDMPPALPPSLARNASSLVLQEKQANKYDEWEEEESPEESLARRTSSLPAIDSIIAFNKTKASILSPSFLAEDQDWQDNEESGEEEEDSYGSDEEEFPHLRATNTYRSLPPVSAQRKLFSGQNMKNAILVEDQNWQGDHDEDEDETGGEEEEEESHEWEETLSARTKKSVFSVHNKNNKQANPADEWQEDDGEEDSQDSREEELPSPSRAKNPSLQPLSAIQTNTVSVRNKEKKVNDEEQDWRDDEKKVSGEGHDWQDDGEDSELEEEANSKWEDEEEEGEEASLNSEEEDSDAIMNVSPRRRRSIERNITTSAIDDDTDDSDLEDHVAVDSDNSLSPETCIPSILTPPPPASHSTYPTLSSTATPQSSSVGHRKKSAKAEDSDWEDNGEQDEEEISEEWEDEEDGVVNKNNVADVSSSYGLQDQVLQEGNYRIEEKAPSPAAVAISNRDNPLPVVVRPLSKLPPLMGTGVRTYPSILLQAAAQNNLRQKKTQEAFPTPSKLPPPTSTGVSTDLSLLMEAAAHTNLRHKEIMQRTLAMQSNLVRKSTEAAIDEDEDWLNEGGDEEKEEGDNLDWEEEGGSGPRAKFASSKSGLQYNNAIVIDHDSTTEEELKHMLAPSPASKSTNKPIARQANPSPVPQPAQKRPTKKQRNTLSVLSQSSLSSPTNKSVADRIHRKQKETVLRSDTPMTYSWDSLLKMGSNSAGSKHTMMGSGALNAFLQRHGAPSRLTTRQVLDVVTHMRPKTLLPPEESPLHEVLHQKNDNYLVEHFQDEILEDDEEEETAEGAAFQQEANKDAMVLTDDSSQDSSERLKLEPKLMTSELQGGPSSIVAAAKQAPLREEQVARTPDESKSPSEVQVTEQLAEKCSSGQTIKLKKESDISSRWKLPINKLTTLYGTMCDQELDDGTLHRREMQYLDAPTLVEKLQSLENRFCALKAREDSVILNGKRLGLGDPKLMYSLMGYRDPMVENSAKTKLAS